MTSRSETPIPSNPPERHVPGRSRVAVIGGGIGGLAAALELAGESRVDVCLFESRGQLGGVLQTTSIDGYLIEHAADNFLADPSTPWMVDLCRRFGLQDELLETDPRYRRALVLKHGQMHAVPAGLRLMLPTRIWPLVTTRLLSPAGKARLMLESWVPKGPPDREETLEQFALRRMGREAFDWLIEPLVSGIYTADASRLSVRAALPRFVEYEQRYGSLTRAALKMRQRRQRASQEAGTTRATSSGSNDESGARYSSFLGPRAGMSSLIARLAAQLPRDCVRISTPVQRLTPAKNRAHQRAAWQLHFVHEQRAWSEEFDAVILALPAPELSKMTRELDTEISSLAGSIPHASSAVVCLGYQVDQITSPLDAFGIVVPRREQRDLLAISFASRKFPDRAPAGAVLLRVFVGGALRPDLIGLSDSDLIELAARQAAEILGITGDPQVCLLQRWPDAMPQYHLGHEVLVDRLQRQISQWPNLTATSNAFGGVGIPQCVRGGQAAARMILRTLGH